MFFLEKISIVEIFECIILLMSQKINFAPHKMDLLNDKIKDVLKTKNIHNLTKIQSLVLPTLPTKDIIAQSPTGSGKTLAFVLPITNYIINKAQNLSNKKIHCLVILPTRELAIQVFSVFQYFEFIKSELYIGGKENNVQDENKNLFESDVPNIVVATPGRLFQIVKYNQKYFSALQFLILDEADKLLNCGFYTLTENIISLLPKQRITGLFTATLDSSIDKLTKVSVRNPKRIVIEETLIPESLEIQYIVVSPFDKLQALLDFLAYKCIVFFSSSAQVEYFHALFLRISKRKLYKIHGKMKNEERFVVYENYKKDGDSLFCTDISARGIDFENIDFVIHFDCPVDPSNFVHRSGRTARNGKEGKSVLFLMKNEEKFINYLQIKKIEVKQRSEQLRNYEKQTEQENGDCDLEIIQKNKVTYTDIKEVFDEQLNKLAVCAFVSYIRSYKEYHLSYIFNLKEIDFDSTAALYFLTKIPQMNEIQHVQFERFKRVKKNNKAKCKRKKFNK